MTEEAEKREEGQEEGKEEEKEEFKHIVRIVDTDLDGKKSVVHSLCGIKGIGRRVAKVIVSSTGIDPGVKMGNLSDDEIEQLKTAIDGADRRLPQWMLNRRKDILSGVDKHIMGADQMLQLREDINLLRKIRSYRGIRHERGLKARGQRTKSTGRRGLVVGVIRKKQLAATGGARERGK
jgi:small subunit ribosomal protein S13